MEEEVKKGLKCTESFWGSRIAKEELRNIEDFQKNLLLSLGLNGVNCFKSSNYNVWPIGVKIWSFHLKQRISKDFILLTLLIPRPNKPKNFNPYLEAI